MDLSKLKSFEPGLVCILDSSAILNNPNWEEYKSLLDLESSKNVYLLVGEVLNQIDHVKGQQGKNRQAEKFFKNLRNIRVKISNGVILQNEDVLYFYPENLITLQDQKIHYIDQNSVDRNLVELGIKLKEAGFEVAILARDSLIQVLCLEFDLRYIFFPDNLSEEITSPDSTNSGAKIDLTSVSDPRSSTISFSPSLSPSASPSEEDAR